METLKTWRARDQGGQKSPGFSFPPSLQPPAMPALTESSWTFPDGGPGESAPVSFRAEQEEGQSNRTKGQCVHLPKCDAQLYFFT